MGKIGINIATGSLQQDEVIVGIDLGTTNSLVAIIHPESGKPVALKEHDSGSLVPSIVHFDEAGRPVVGEPARLLLETHPESTIFSAKRLMGKSYADLKPHADFFTYKIIDNDTESLIKVQVGNRFYSPVELSSFILSELKSRAEHILKTKVSKAVITVPAYFNDAQRQATRDAGKLAGLDVLRIVNEPTAASLAYGIGQQDGAEKIIAVYDLGGGTFDISILRIHEGVFEVLSTNGDTYLGGDDIDHTILRYWMEQAGITGHDISDNKSFLQQLRLSAEQAKKHLSANDDFNTRVQAYDLSISRATLEQLIAPLISKTLNCAAMALKDAGIAASEVQEVVMVGGSTRIPAIKKSVSDFFGRPVHDDINPDEVVALGAAVQAQILAGKNKDVLLLDVTPLSLGIETMGGLMDVLIPRNSKIPTSAGRQYTTQKDGQSGIVISVYQGERDLVQHNRKLAAFTLSGIPAMPAGLPKVDIKFLINADGILQVQARELRSGVTQEIQVQPQYGLTDEQVEQMLLESITHAKDDIAVRALVEAKTEGQQLLETTEKFITRHAAELTPLEMTDTALAMQALQLALTMDDKNLIQEKTEALNEVSRPYAERVMDSAIGQRMKGEKI